MVGTCTNIKTVLTPNRQGIRLLFGPKKSDCQFSKLCVIETQKTCNFFYEKEEVNFKNLAHAPEKCFETCLLDAILTQKYPD